MQNVYYFVCQWDILLANASMVIGNPLARLLQGVEGYWQSSDKFFRQHLCLSKGCQNRVIFAIGIDYTPEQLAGGII
jgi:hypothetical protein